MQWHALVRKYQVVPRGTICKPVTELWPVLQSKIKFRTGFVTNRKPILIKSYLVFTWSCWNNPVSLINSLRQPRCGVIETMLFQSDTWWPLAASNISWIFFRLILTTFFYFWMSPLGDMYKNRFWTGSVWFSKFGNRFWYLNSTRTLAVPT